MASTQVDARQRVVAVLGAKPRNLVLGSGQDDKTIAAEGVKGSALSKDECGLLLELIGVWVTMLPDAAAARRQAEIKGQAPEKRVQAAAVRVPDQARVGPGRHDSTEGRAAIPVRAGRAEGKPVIRLRRGRRFWHDLCRIFRTRH
jgi:hypothetical protein